MKINIILKNLIFIGIALIWFSSCKKDSDEPVIQKYDMQYIVKVNGDQNLKSITVRTATYYSLVNREWWIWSRKHKTDSLYGSKKYLNDYDSIIVQPADKVYNGCSRKMGVELWYIVGMDTIYKYYLFQLKKIVSESDCRVEFIWPDDSSKYEYLDSNYWWN